MASPDNQMAELVCDALKMGLRRGYVKRHGHHTDRGSQYASNAFRSLIQRHGLRQSMSGKGNCYDNAQASFSQGSRPSLGITHGKVFTSVDDRPRRGFRLHRSYYNRRRPHSALGHISPMAFEQYLKNKTRRTTRDTFMSSFI